MAAAAAGDLTPEARAHHDPGHDLPQRWVYKFGGGHADGNKSMRAELGGKGANLAEMAALHLPVPPGFTITTRACKFVVEHKGSLPKDLLDQVDVALEATEELLGAKLGDGEGRPLLLSVRSGAAVSMPGMLDTVLNLGLNDTTAAALTKATDNPRFVNDSYRRFVNMFGEVVHGISHETFEGVMDKLKAEVGASSDLELNADHLLDLVGRYKAKFAEVTGEPFPDDPKRQLLQAIEAVFNSWDTPRAVAYRKINKIRGLLGTAVNVQAMVYGNFGATSGTGVLFTRHPSTGEDVLFGEYLENAQGEDVVAGIRTPMPIARLKEINPDVYDELYTHVKRLERHFKNVQDCEFTVQEGKLYCLQTRDGKRTGAAALRIAVAMVQEGLVTETDAVERLVTPAHVDQLLHPRFRDEESYRSSGAVLCKGLGASPGAAVGRVTFDPDEAQREYEETGAPLILVRLETSPEDVKGMNAARGILTARGGMTSHAAVVARGWGKPCVCGCKEVEVNYEAGEFRVGDRVVRAGDWLSLQGTTGEVVLGKHETVAPELSGDLKKFQSWVDRVRSRMAVRANADTPEDCARARELGAVGVGLVRTEHMFFKDDRVWAVRAMIMANDDASRSDALAKMFEYQREDFVGIYRAMSGLPVTVRLLDPPLHEFLPQEDAAQAEMATRLGVPLEDVRKRVALLEETNPMMAHRGCRLGITHPEITEMQARAIVSAACAVAAEGGPPPVVEIMVPLITSVEELNDQYAIVERVATEVQVKSGVSVPVSIGTMIETPRAALMSAAIAAKAEFFSFGTNDLTQMTFGFSRDDSSKFLPHYINAGIMKDDPFQTIDVAGVGQLVKNSVAMGRATKPGFKCGVCGEHGGDVRSVEFFYSIGLNYVSCSPFRVPSARLASAQAHLKALKEGRVHGAGGTRPVTA